MFLCYFWSGLHNKWYQSDDSRDWLLQNDSSLNFCSQFFLTRFKVVKFIRAKREYLSTLCKNFSIKFALFWKLCSAEIRVSGYSRIQFLTCDLGEIVISRDWMLQISCHLWEWLGHKVKLLCCEFKGLKWKQSLG